MGTPPSGSAPSLAALRDRLSRTADVVQHDEFLEIHVEEGQTLLVFNDGRTVVEGTDDPSVARTLHARYIGS